MTFFTITTYDADVDMTSMCHIEAGDATAAMILWARTDWAQRLPQAQKARIVIDLYVAPAPQEN